MPTGENTDVATGEFLNFAKGLGLRQEHINALWNADLRSPQELAAADKAHLSGICNNPVLLNHVHPLLSKYAVNIATANDPYKKALSIIRKNMPKDDSGEEMETDSLASDARGFVGNQAQPSTGAVPERPSSNRGSANGTPPQRDSTTISNHGTNVRASGRNVVQTSVGRAPYTDGKNVTISGGNFVQANVMGNGPVTYTNTNTTITTNLGPGKDGDYGLDVKKLRMERLNESFILDGTAVDVSDMDWQDRIREDFWPDQDFDVNRSSMDLLARHYSSGQVYRVQNTGGSRALIINNHDFSPSSKMNKRTGADMDSKNMKKLFEKLGFQVEHHENKTATDMKEILHDFAKSHDNLRADMIAIYIGSHGERDDRANDTFVGVDGNRVNFNEVKKWFTPNECPFLEDKPKIFFLQFCRQDNKQTTTENDGIVEADATAFETETSLETRLMDCVSVYATLAGNKAYRDTATGSWFVTALVGVLKDGAKDKDLLTMLTEVNNSVSQKSGQEGSTRAVQISEVLHNLRRKIYFYPGIGR